MISEQTTDLGGRIERAEERSIPYLFIGEEIEKTTDIFFHCDLKGH